MNMMRLLPLLGVVVLLAGCASLRPDPTAGWSAERFHEQAQRLIRNGNYLQAIDYLQTLESRYPFGNLAEQSILDRGYAYYKYGSTEEALAEFDRFIHLYPQHRHVDYAYYMRGIIEHETEQRFLDRYVSDPAQRDTETLRRAFGYFNELIEKFPNSEYATDAAQRMTAIIELLARHELAVAYYYTDRRAYVAAINRASYLVENYANTTVIAEGLALLAYNYRQAGLMKEAEDAERVLRLNFPSYQLAYRPDR